MLRRSIVIPILIIGTAAILLIGLRAEWSPWKENGSIRTTDDASVRADQVPLSTRVSGTVRHVYVRDYQPVAQGQLIAELEDSDYQAAVLQAEAALRGANAEYAANQDAKRAEDAAVAAARESVAGAEAGLVVAQAGIDAKQATQTQAETEYQRQQVLLQGKAATKQHFEDAQSARDRASADLQAHRAEYTRAHTLIASAQAALTAAAQQRAALNAKDQLLLAQIQAKKAAITIAEVNLGYTKIYAPSAGSVGEFHVHPGQLLGLGMAMVDLVQSDIWLQANYRETQLAGVQAGDTVDIHVDAVPGHTFYGRVMQISPASGSQFALLPPDNATGNYTKIVQRIPVRIDFNGDEHLHQLRPGFSAVVGIHASSAGQSRTGSTEPRQRDGG